MGSNNEGPVGVYSSAHFIPRFQPAGSPVVERLRPRRQSRVPVPQQRSNTKERRAFPYEPLDPAKHEIRLFELWPGKPGSKVVGRLFHVSLDDNPRFEALSYTWGPLQPTYNISINGHKKFPVHRNLRKALDDLRQPNKPRVLWTDAICINQGSKEEKKHQIKLMGSIYSSAQVVCAWLDHSVRPMDVSFDDLARLGEEVQIDDYDPSHWYPVADIFRNPYWRRLWIQQELILAKKINIYCQRDVFDGQQLLGFQQRVNDDSFFKKTGDTGRLSKYMDTGRKPHQMLGGNILQARANRLLGSKLHHQQSSDGVTRFEVTGRYLGSSLLQLFFQTAGLNMTDPRDRVYGILGLALDIDESKVRVDYDAPVIEIHLQVFSLFIERHQSIDFLCFLDEELHHAASRGDDFPTWVPRNSVNWGSVNASRACGSITARTASIDLESRILYVQGLLVDIIEYIGLKEFDELPILECYRTLEEYCRRLWPEDAGDEPLYEREDVTMLLRSWVSEKRYRQFYQHGLARPTHETTVALLRAIRVVAEQVDQDRLTLYDLAYRPRSDFLTEYQFMCKELRSILVTSVFVGTECRRLGTLNRSVGTIELGDQVWVLHGCRMPVALRPVPGKNARFTVIGPAIFPGLMHGEAMSNGEAELKSTVVELE
ncbi:hypothetical protein BDV24DRAFT_78158 [Aspergillus arachidicola]|uniref:Heterokaryon incompatibility domain-containing protein n=1 Tax=Aspergillus arachidicola TaxID=656916 RepID=A0A5N6Y1C4_9EURO|nr:hypothetical protein BDV24DRAFT_78158 [Aspergillus arachidicola]